MSRSPQSPSHAAFPLDLLPDEIVHRIGLFSPYRLAFPTGALNKTLYRIFRDPLAIAVRSLRSFYGNYVDGSPAEKAIAREASRGDAAVVERLMIKFGAQIDRRSPIEAAALNGHVAVVRLLLSHGATATNTTALAGAARNGHIDVMQTLLDSGKCEQRERDASLSRAVESGASKEQRVAMLELLLKHGADPGAHRCFALHAAVEQREWDILRLLIERGRVGPGQAIDGALGALTEPNVDVVQHLLGLGAQPHVLHWDVLLALATQGHFELLQSLVRNHVLSEAVFLRFAFERNSVDGVKAILLAFPNLRDALQNERYDRYHGRFRYRDAGVHDVESESLVSGALFEAAGAGSVDMVRFCLESGADPLSKSADKALDRAIRAGHLLLVQTLLDASVPVSETHVQWSAEGCLHHRDPTSTERLEILNLLLSRGANPLSTAQVFVAAVQWGRHDLVAALLKFETKGWPISDADMIQAVLVGRHFRVVELLLESGIGDPALFCKVALVAAAKSGRRDAVEWVLREAGKRGLNIHKEVAAAARGGTDDVRALLRSRVPSLELP